MGAFCSKARALRERHVSQKVGALPASQLKNNTSANPSVPAIFLGVAPEAGQAGVVGLLTGLTGLLW